GPAKEIHDFLEQEDICDRAQLTLLDFNDETLESTGQKLNEVKARFRRFTGLQFIKKSVHQVLKEGGKASALGQQYDFIYCAGLFDYLSDRICKRLMTIFYEQLAPGGLVVATNVDACNPIKNIMEYIFEWHLVYRDNNQLGSLIPDDSPQGMWSVKADHTGANIFVEVRKPL
ncbi:MAG: SAM-dependent methyltransferase, partial [Verrucomicrobia bacterium]|nr:SAM-dependent methyltransferase [Verrucomicrobiota bacterium]